MLDIVKKVFIVLLIPMVAIFILFSIPYLYPPKEAEPYPFMELGTDTIINILWDSSAQKFKEMPLGNPAYWVDDQSKLLWLLLENPSKYQTYITTTTNNLYSVFNDGYFPRRWVVLNPQIISNTTTNVEMQNGFLKIMGDLTGENIANALKIRYYESAGFTDMAFLGGQLFTIARTDINYHWITYDISHLRAEQSQNPSFDIWNPSWSNETMMLPWMFSYPQHWFYSNEPPLKCSYSARWVFEEPNYGRCIGLEVNNEGSEKDWRCEEFDVLNDTSFSLTFHVRGSFTSGTPFRVYVRWFDASHSWIAENVTEYSSTYDSWQDVSMPCKSPVNAKYGDIRIVSYADTIGNYYFDDFEFSGWSSLVQNGDFEDASGFPFDLETYHSSYKDIIGRSLKLYSSYEYGIQWLPVTVPFDNFYKITYFCKTETPTTNIKVHVFYSDGTRSELTKPCNESDWVQREVQQSELTSGKTIVAFGFQTSTTGIATWIDDVGFHYKPTNAQKSYAVDSTIDNYGIVQTVQASTLYSDDDLNLNVTWQLGRFTYVQQIMGFNDKIGHPYDVYYTSALDGLDTINSGEGEQLTHYSSVWIPNVGRRSHNITEFMTVLFDYSEAYKWNRDYFIVECKQIPEWHGSFGLIVKAPHDLFNVLIDTNPKYPNASETNSYFHYLTYSYRKTGFSNFASDTFSLKLICLDGYDFIHPEIYDYYMTNLEQFWNVDLSMNYHIGTIMDALAKHYVRVGTDAYGMAKTTWSYYNNVFTNHNNGSYLLTTGKTMEASMILYEKTKDSQYLDFAKLLANYLVNLQITNSSDKRYGTFPMKDNGMSYLDCQGACLYGLKLLTTYNASYQTTFNLGLSVIHYDYVPSGFHQISIDEFGFIVPHIKRLFVYANASAIDSDFWTYKSAYVTMASIGMNDTLTMLALSRIWRNTIWIEPQGNNEGSLIIYTCESIPNRAIEGIPLVNNQTNSETQPYCLMAWKTVAELQRNTFQWYYSFLKNHYAITSATLSSGTCNVQIYGLQGIGTFSSFYLKGTKSRAVPTSIKVDGVDVPQTDALNKLYTSPSNCYFYDEQYNLVVKAFIPSDTDAQLNINFNIMPFEGWSPIMPIIGMIGILMMCISPVFTISKIKEGEYVEAIGYGFILFIVGFGFIMAYLWM